MKLCKTPQEWTTHSAQLITARPSTTKITTTYGAAAPGKGKLTLKTYDPASGVVIKFRTNKIADVGRLVGFLHRLARAQTGAPEAKEGKDVSGDTTMADAPPTVVESGEKMPDVTQASGGGGGNGGSGSGSGSGKKGKKKGKRGKS